MGYGDSLMAIGDAWKLHQLTQRRVAIGTGSRLETMGDLARGLDFLADEQDIQDAETPWVISYPGYRPYIDYNAMRSLARQRGLSIDKNSKLVSRLGRYVWRIGYTPTPAPVVMTEQERAIVDKLRQQGPMVFVEPFIKEKAPKSKQYPVERMREIALALQKDVKVYQISAPHMPELDPMIPRMKTRSFRETMIFLGGATLYIGPEGGLHHASAAMNTRAVVLFGGYIPPSLTGYDFHVNLTGDSGRACGIRENCNHCQKAFNAITPDDVLAHARRQIEFEYAV